MTVLAPNFESFLQGFVNSMAHVAKRRRGRPRKIKQLTPKKIRQSKQADRLPKKRGFARNFGRHKAICEMHVAGGTLQAIGLKFGVTRQCIEQVLKANGLGRKDGGRFKTLFEKRLADAESKAARLDRRAMTLCKRLDCTYLQAWACNDNESLWSRLSLAGKYFLQKRSAAHRGIPWEITFPEWADAWIESGFLEVRGRKAKGGKGYCMARKADMGPYSVGNIYFTTNAENARDYQDRLKINGIVCDDGYRRLPTSPYFDKAAL